MYLILKIHWSEEGGYKNITVLRPHKSSVVKCTIYVCTKLVKNIRYCTFLDTNMHIIFTTVLSYLIISLSIVLSYPQYY